MRHYFTDECLNVDLRRNENKIVVTIDSDYARSNRKGQLYVSGEGVAKDILDLWKSIKTKKLARVHLSFDEIDWYDDEVDVYETPSVSIQRGLKRAKVSHRTHGSIPKEWSVDLTCVFLDTTTNTPIIEVVKSALGRLYTSEVEKQFVKQLKPFLQKKANYARFEADFD